jgi:hypothetical protein
VGGYNLGMNTAGKNGQRSYLRRLPIVHEFRVPADFAVGEHDNIVGSVYSYERDDPDHVIFQRLINGVWTDVTCAQAAQQIRSTGLGLIAEGVNAGDRVAILSATRYEYASSRPTPVPHQPASTDRSAQPDQAPVSHAANYWLG